MTQLIMTYSVLLYSHNTASAAASNFSYFPFGFQSRICVLIASVSGLCIRFSSIEYFSKFYRRIFVVCFIGAL